MSSTVKAVAEKATTASATSAATRSSRALLKEEEETSMVVERIRVGKGTPRNKSWPTHPNPPPKLSSGKREAIGSRRNRR